MATDASEPIDLIGLLASDQLRQGASVSIRTLFMAELVTDGEVLFSTNPARRHYRVFLLYVCDAENVMVASQLVGDWFVNLCAANDLGILSRALVSRRTSN